MTKAILVTGVSGTGKSTLGKKLRELGYTVHDIENIPGMFTTTDTRTGEVLHEWDTNNLEQIKNLKFNCSAEVLKRLIKEETHSLSFYCGTATNIEEIIPLFEKVVLLQANPEIVRERLSTRTTHDFARAPNMQDWVMGEIKGPFEDTLKRAGALVINADGTVEETSERVLDAVKD